MWQFWLEYILLDYQRPQELIHHHIICQHIDLKTTIGLKPKAWMENVLKLISLPHLIYQLKRVMDVYMDLQKFYKSFCYWYFFTKLLKK